MSLRVDEIDKRILALLVQDGRRTYEDIGREVALSSPAVKRRVDRLRASGVIVGFSAVLNHEALGSSNEALVELFWVNGTMRDRIVESLRRHPSVIEAWAVTGEADVIVRVRMSEIRDLEQLVMDLHIEGLVVRTRSSIIMRQLVEVSDNRSSPLG